MNFIINQGFCGLTAARNYFVIIVAVTMSSCLAPRTFYHEGVEPVLTPKQSRAQVNVSYRFPTKLNVAGCFAPTEHIVLRATGAYGLGYASAGFSPMVFLGKDKINFILGPNINYQQRQQTKKLSIPFVDHNDYILNCRYLSGGLNAGLHYSTGKKQHQFMLSVNYNNVLNYDYFYRHSENSGKDIAVTFDREEIHTSIPNFYSGEFNYFFLNPVRKNIFFKFQFGIQYVQKTFVHNYTFDSQEEMQGITEAIGKRLHPLSNPFNTSIGFIFYLPR